MRLIFWGFLHKGHSNIHPLKLIHISKIQDRTEGFNIGMIRDC
jgi:hypothetical protein